MVKVLTWGNNIYNIFIIHYFGGILKLCIIEFINVKCIFSLSKLELSYDALL
jgi:hypothetical protein